MKRRSSSLTRTLDLSIKHLRAVCAVAEYGNFTAAAAELRTSQPAISRLVGQVEERLGVSLFQRSTRNVMLTPQGRDFSTAVIRFLQDLDDQVDGIRATGGKLRGRLVISCLLSLTHHIVPAALMTYRKTYPGVVVQLREGLGMEVNEDVRSGLADFGIGNAVGAGSEIVAQDVVKENCFVVLPSRHRLAGHRTITFQQLASSELVSLPPESGLRRQIDGIAASQALALNHMTVVEQFGSLFDFVAAGLGIAVVPASAMPKRLRASLTARPVANPAIVRNIGILRLRSRPLAPAAEAFLEIFGPRFKAAARR